MKNFHFTLPTEIIFENGCVQRFADKWIIGKKALIVTGKQSAVDSGALADVTTALESRGIAYAHFNGITANPDDEQVYAGAAMAVAEGCDFVVGIGGGSPLDAAKAIAWVAGAKIPREDFFAKQPAANDCVLPIVAVPLTCGTGSEVTPYAIITNHTEQTKCNVSAPALFPKVALLDSKYLESLPKCVLCDTALDALSHAIEGAYSLRTSRLTEALAEEAIRIIVPELIRMAHGAFVNIKQLQYASLLAGIVIAQAGTGLVHAMGYPLTYHRNIPHGRANGILLSGYLEFMMDSCTGMTNRILKAAGIDDPNELQALVDSLLEITGCHLEPPSENDFLRFTHYPLQLHIVRRYRTLPSPEDVMDIYRTGF